MLRFLPFSFVLVFSACESDASRSGARDASTANHLDSGQSDGDAETSPSTQGGHSTQDASQGMLSNDAQSEDAARPLASGSSQLPDAAVCHDTIPLAFCVDLPPPVSPMSDPNTASGVTLQGTITEVHLGFPTAGLCASSSDNTHVSWFTLATAAREIQVTVNAPGFDVKTLAHQQVSVALQYSPEPSDTFTAPKLLSVTSDQGFLLWLGDDAALGQLSPPLALALGQTPCEVADECGGSVSRFSLDVILDGQHFDIPHGSQREVPDLNADAAGAGDSYVVTNAELQLPTSPGCDGLHAAHARVAIWPQSALSALPVGDASAQSDASVSNSDASLSAP